MSPEDETKVVALMRAARAKARGYADFFLWSIDRDETAIKAFKAGREYEWADWDQPKFAAALTNAVSRKNDKYPKLKGAPYPGGFIVVVHTDEPGLRFETAKDFLERSTLPKQEYIDRAFLLLSYDPGRECCPCIELTV